METLSTQYETATAEQLQMFEKLGISISKSVPRSLAQAFIETSSATEKQIACLKRFGFKTDEPIRKTDATNKIAESIDYQRQLAPTRRQESFLRERGKWRTGMLRGEAFDLIGAIKWDEKRKRL